MTNLHGRFITVKHPNTQSRLPYLLTTAVTAVSRLALCDYNLHGRFITVKHPNTQSRLPYLRQMLSKLFSQQRHLRGSYIRQSVQVSGVLPRARELGHTGNELKSRNGPAKRENREAPERLQVW